MIKKSKRYLPSGYLPTMTEISKYLTHWTTLGNYVAQESALKMLYSAYPNNTNLDEVLVKVATLNDFYSTNIYSVYPVAVKIVGIPNIDSRLKSGDKTLVDDIAKVSISSSQTKVFYSFASKYCSHHIPNSFPILDSFVIKVLKELNQRDKFTSLSIGSKFIDSLKVQGYSKYKQIIDDFMKFYSLSCTYKELDRYLWQLGKDYFK
ncbi:MAG: hypothetical protein MJZ00_03210 [Paludibacteraceae bacterium]|nr:hypothetical protein [Paludibacteraceae bacterium]